VHGRIPGQPVCHAHLVGWLVLNFEIVFLQIQYPTYLTALEFGLSLQTFEGTVVGIAGEWDTPQEVAMLIYH
jgi:hypothetical protein